MIMSRPTFYGCASFILLAMGLSFTTTKGLAQPASIAVNPAQVMHPLSHYLTGACLEDVNHEVYGGLYSQMIFGESFQEPAPSPPLLNFTNHGGTWLATNGILTSANGPGPKLIYNEFKQSNGNVSLELRFAASEGGNAGIIFQVSQPGVGADIFDGYEISLSPGGYLEFGKHMQNFQSISRISCAVPLNQWIKLKVKYTNATMSAFVNGTNLIQYTDTQNPLTNGLVGLRNYEQGVQFQNFYINGAQIPLVSRAIHWAGMVSGVWEGDSTSSVVGQYSLETNAPFVGIQSQRITLTSGTGEIGVANRGLNRRGMNFVAGREYDGCLDVRADAPTVVTVALESADGSKVYAAEDLPVTSNQWGHLDFALTPSAGDGDGRFAVELKQPGSVVVGYTFLEPGAWGLFKGLPVRRDVAEGLINQGITVLRYGGSMVNAAGYRWKNMVGWRDRRPPYTGTWYPYSSDGWGIPDFLNFCEAAGFLAVPDFDINETPQDMADFAEYVNGPTNTVWGAQRLADGHPQPYGLKYIELGNEETVNHTYYQKFQALAKAIWAADSNLTLVVGDFSYSQNITNPFDFGGAASGITSLAAQKQILQLAGQYNREVWFDLHVWTEGPFVDPTLTAMFSYADALDKIADGAKHKVVVFELNAQNHSLGRALGNALAINAAERDGRLPIVTSANCLQPDGQNDNGWDQGLLFLNQSNVWLQPPGYVTQLYSKNYEPLAVESEITDPNHQLDVTAERSEDGNQLVLKVVNPGPKTASALIILDHYSPRQPFATVEELDGSLGMVNSAKSPGLIRTTRKRWITRFDNGESEYSFPPHSLTLMEFN
jgi:hypothetical protein